MLIKRRQNSHYIIVKWLAIFFYGCISWRNILISLSKSVPHPPLNHKRKNTKSKSNYDFEAIFVLWLQFWFVYCSPFETWKTQTAFQISFFFDDDFFSCSFIANQFFWSKSENQYEMSGKSDIWLWCLIHVLWGRFVDFGLKSLIRNFWTAPRNPQNWWTHKA